MRLTDIASTHSLCRLCHLVKNIQQKEVGDIPLDYEEDNISYYKRIFDIDRLPAKQK